MPEDMLAPSGIESNKKISLALKPVRLSVIDESRQHAGHGNHHPDGETHFRIEIVSDAFAGLNRLARHRLVNSILRRSLPGAFMPWP